MLKAREIVRVLLALGFEEIRQTGAHRIFKHQDGRMTLVPQHGGEDIGRGLLRRMLNEIRLTPEDFLTYL